jgi:hypothetical protein
MRHFSKNCLSRLRRPWTTRLPWPWWSIWWTTWWRSDDGRSNGSNGSTNGSSYGWYVVFVFFASCRCCKNCGRAIFPVPTANNQRYSCLGFRGRAGFRGRGRGRFFRGARQGNRNDSNSNDVSSTYNG